MPEQNQGQIGVFPFHVQREAVDILDQAIGAPARHGEAERGGVRRGVPVPEVVVTEHQKAKAGEIFGKSGVAQEVFAHAV